MWRLGDILSIPALPTAVCRMPKSTGALRSVLRGWRYRKWENDHPIRTFDAIAEPTSSRSQGMHNSLHVVICVRAHC